MGLQKEWEEVCIKVKIFFKITLPRQFSLYFRVNRLKANQPVWTSKTRVRNQSKSLYYLASLHRCLYQYTIVQNEPES